MIEEFWNELSQGEIYVRDNLQFELKSEFTINPYLKRNIYKQEFFLFIPSSLQINSQTYSKHQFYLDQTNLIRYRTPSISFADLINPHYEPSPLNRLQKFINPPPSPLKITGATDELKLFGAMFRATLRTRVYELMKGLEQAGNQKVNILLNSIADSCIEVTQVCQKFRQLKQAVAQSLNHHHLNRYFKYIDEFISTRINEYFLILLKQLRRLDPLIYHQSDKQICQLILEEKVYRQKHHLVPKTSRKHLFYKEAILYRYGLLNRFVLEALMLQSYRFSIEEKHSNIIGATAAGLAMLVYMILFVWKISLFVINSFPFVALAVLFYILKDRIKEGLKQLYSH